MVVGLLKFLVFTVPLCFAVAATFDILQCWMTGRPMATTVALSATLWCLVAVTAGAAD